MKSVTNEQVFEVGKLVVGRVNWKSVDHDLLQQIIKDPARLGREFTRIFQTGWQTSFDGMKVATSPFKLTTIEPINCFYWEIVFREHDECNDGITEIDLSKINLLTCLTENEKKISGDEKLTRIKMSSHIRYGANVFMGLRKDYLARKNNSVLEMLYVVKGIIHVDFFGDVLSFIPNGNRFVLCFDRDNKGQWNHSFRWLGSDWSAIDLSMVSLC